MTGSDLLESQGPRGSRVWRERQNSTILTQGLSEFGFKLQLCLKLIMPRLNCILQCSAIASSPFQANYQEHCETSDALRT